MRKSQYEASLLYTSALGHIAVDVGEPEKFGVSFSRTDKAAAFAAAALKPLLNAATITFLRGATFSPESFGGAASRLAPYLSRQARSLVLSPAIPVQGFERFWADDSYDVTPESQRGSLLFLFEKPCSTLDAVLRLTCGHTHATNILASNGATIRFAREWVLGEASRVAVLSEPRNSISLYVFGSEKQLRRILQLVVESELGAPLAAAPWEPEPAIYYEQIIEEATKHVEQLKRRGKPRAL